MSNAYGQFWNRVHIPHIVSFGQNRDGSVFALDANGTCHPYDGSIESAIAEIRAVVGGAQPPFAWDVMGVTVTVDSIKGQFSFKWNGHWYRRDSLAEARAYIVDLMGGSK